MPQAFCIIEVMFDDGRVVDFRFLETNPAFEKQTGLCNVAGKTMRELRPDHEQHWFEAYGKVAKDGKPVHFENHAAELAGGVWYDGHAFPFGPDGCNQVAVVFQDVTKRKKSEEALHASEGRLQQANIRLQELNKGKTDFFNDVSHEFKTPLTLLMGPLNDVIKTNRSNLNAGDLQKLELSYRGAIRLQKLVHTLLDFARIEAGKVESFYQPTDFTRITLDLASQFRTAVESAGLKYIIKPESITEPVYLNREMWEKIVFNLISNALKYTHKGKIQVVVHDKNRSVEFRVRDTGVGIPEKNIHKVFERFVRLESNKGRATEGTGIGLALVRELVWAHKGNIKVRSEEGKGSEFIVTIPKGKAHLPQQQVYENKKQLPSTLMSDLFVQEALGWLPGDHKADEKKEKEFRRAAGTHILIADDNADMREYLTGIFMDKYTVLAVENGKKVIDFLGKGGYADMIIADATMPEINGYELVDFLKSNPKYRTIPILLLSAKSTEEARIEGLSVGAEDYVIKPFSAAELSAVVNSRMKDRSSGQSMQR
jgi:PAS domain S-box-containing protein